MIKIFIYFHSWSLSLSLPHVVHGDNVHHTHYSGLVPARTLPKCWKRWKRPTTRPTWGFWRWWRRTASLFINNIVVHIIRRWWLRTVATWRPPLTSLPCLLSSSLLMVRWGKQDVLLNFLSNVQKIYNASSFISLTQWQTNLQVKVQLIGKTEVVDKLGQAIEEATNEMK